jgi:hypothetical protein
MIRIIIIIFFAIASFIWADWSNTKKYYPTILFFITCNLIHLVIYRNSPQWSLEPLWPIQNILYDDAVITLVLNFTVFPCTTILYLSNYPKGKKQFIYIFLWVLLYSSIELIMLKYKGITYHNGWNFKFSFLFDIFIFSILRIHYLCPIKAWLLSVIFSFLIMYFSYFPIII